MALQLSQKLGTITEIPVTYSIFRVTQDSNINGSITVTLHMEKRGTLPDGSVISLGPLEAFTGTYPSAEGMVAATAATWAPTQADRKALSDEILKGPLQASEAILSAYVSILNAAQSYLASRKSQ
jgi:hypothetical protein